MVLLQITTLNVTCKFVQWLGVLRIQLYDWGLKDMYVSSFTKGVCSLALVLLCMPKDYFTEYILMCPIKLIEFWMYNHMNSSYSSLEMDMISISLPHYLSSK